MKPEKPAMTIVTLFFLAITFFTVNLSRAAEPIELKLTHWVPADNVMHKDVFVPWAKMVEEKTAGKVKVTIYPSELLSKARDTYESVVNGTADIGFSHLGLNPGVFTVNQIFGLPFLYPEAPEGSRIITEVYEKEPVLQSEFKDVKLLWFMSSTMLRLHTATKPIRTLEDLKGMKIRTGGGPQAATLKTLGATPVAISPPDVYTALERGTVDGLTFPWEAVDSYKIDEVTKYHNTAGLWGGPFYVVMNLKKYNSLPPDVRKALDSLSGKWASEFSTDLREKADIASREKIRKLKGHEFIDFSREEVVRWKSAAMPIWDEFISSVEKKGIPGKKILEEVNRSVEKYSK
ncbi:MAG: C4-dicarboxylate ABC transporter substrate-binding protein [Deltaproteobacteria bacterium HGW-Deltaproteobacteria-15]|nr:MAG: C4-dicarboxylate ABC transporter substrate-binding protein [Deltaproteobacteria bacterium HGW-Deltaproteobacteria-15]